MYAKRVLDVGGWFQRGETRPERVDSDKSALSFK